MSNSKTMFTLLALLAPVGCDDSVVDDIEAAPVDAADHLQDADHDRVERPALELLVDGQPSPERLLAAVEADPDTTLYFLKGDPDAQGRFAVHVAILGRDGGPDYGGQLASEQATPLELYLAVTADERPIPPELQLAHDWQVERSRPGDAAPRDLAALAPDPSSAIGPSVYTCLSWSNFQSYMAGRFLGEPGRVEFVDSAVGGEGLWSDTYASSKVDMVACNYNSSDSPGYDDQIRANLCYREGLGPNGIEEYCYQGLLYDGWYLRLVYGPTYESTRYFVTVEPLSAAALQSFSGIVKANP